MRNTLTLYSGWETAGNIFIFIMEALSANILNFLKWKRRGRVRIGSGKANLPGPQGTEHTRATATPFLPIKP